MDPLPHIFPARSVSQSAASCTAVSSTAHGTTSGREPTQDERMNALAMLAARDGSDAFVLTYDVAATESDVKDWPMWGWIRAATKKAAGALRSIPAAMKGN